MIGIFPQNVNIYTIQDPSESVYIYIYDSANKLKGNNDEKYTYMRCA